MMNVKTSTNKKERNEKRTDAKIIIIVNLIILGIAIVLNVFAPGLVKMPMILSVTLNDLFWLCLFCFDVALAILMTEKYNEQL